MFLAGYFFSSLKISAFQIEISKQNLIIQLNDPIHLISLFYRWKPSRLLTIVQNYDGGELLCEAWSVYVESFSQFWHSGYIHLDKFELGGSVAVGILIP